MKPEVVKIYHLRFNMGVETFGPNISFPKKYDGPQTHDTVNLDPTRL